MVGIGLSVARSLISCNATLRGVLKVTMPLLIYAIRESRNAAFNLFSKANTNHTMIVNHTGRSSDVTTVTVAKKWEDHKSVTDEGVLLVFRIYSNVCFKFLTSHLLFSKNSRRQWDQLGTVCNGRRAPRHFEGPEGGEGR